MGPLDERIVTTAGTLDVLREVEQFLYREARLMDSNEYKEWLALWAPDCTYWLTSNDDDADPHEHIALVYQDYRGIEDRVWRLSGLHAHAQRPKSRLVRVVSNIEVERADGMDIRVHSTFVLCEVRKNATHYWMGRNLHVLVRSDDGLRIRLKKVNLVNNDTVMPNLTFII